MGTAPLQGGLEEAEEEAVLQASAQQLQALPSGFCAAAAGSALGTGRSSRRGGGPGSCGGPGRAGGARPRGRSDAGAAPGLGTACPCTAGMLVDSGGRQRRTKHLVASSTARLSQTCQSRDTCGGLRRAGSAGHCEEIRRLHSMQIPESMHLHRSARTKEIEPTTPR